MSEWLLRNHREIGRRDGARSMILRRDYPAPIDDVWYEPGDEQQRLAGIVAGAWVSLAQAEGLPLPPLPPGWT